MTQKQLGQFYTNKNIFNHPVFIKWIKNIPKIDKNIVLEPFAGKNGIIKMLLELKLIKKYQSYDILPGHHDVFFKDTVLDFPKNYGLVITNPPFLAKNSAARRGLESNIEQYNDIYELCLDKCLKNTKYLAAIVPESFIVTTCLKNRLEIVISLAQRHIFKDTEHPVCLALFGTEYNQGKYLIYRNRELLGSNNEIHKNIQIFFSDNSHEYIVQHNIPIGNIGLISIDATDCTKQIKFTSGEEIKQSDVNGASRLRTRFNILNIKGNQLTEIQTKNLIVKLNKNLAKYRKMSQDTELTAFKGMRDDGYYRRRLDFTTARKIIDLTLAKL